MGSGGAIGRMDTTGFHISSLLLLSSQTFSLKSCDNCLPVAQCPQWCDKLQTGLSSLSLDERTKVNENICGFQFNADPAVKLCCDGPADKDACKKEKSQPKLREIQVQRKAKCGQILIEGENQCGGCDDVSSPGAWPWIARILYEGNFGPDKNSKETTHCGGALVSARHVVTAAHCTDSSVGKPVAVDLGELDVRTEFDCYQTVDECGASGSEGAKCFEEGRCAARKKRYEVKSSLVHPCYKKNSASGRRSKPQFDVAVLVLERRVQFTTTIQPLCLPDPRSDIEKTSTLLVLTGWGNVVKGIEAGISARVLQELRNLNETQLDECRKLVGRVASLETHHMCVWKPGSGSSGCQGDSGGPVAEVIRKNEFDKGFWDLAGVVSFGMHRACASNTPLVLTRVSDPSILNWIKEKVGKDLPERP